MAKAKKISEPQEKVVIAYKGFDKNYQCRGYQYKIGETYVHEGEVKACEGGFHACENPIDVFTYYAPGDSRFCVVELAGELSRHDSDSKIAAGRITLKAELSIPEIVTKTIEWVTALCKPADAQHATGDRSASSATGDRSASSATGDQSASSATGYQSASSATGDQSASSATGDQSASSATGDQSASSVEGNAAVAINIGRYGKAKAGKDGAIVLCNHDSEGNLRHIRASKVGENGIEAGVWYTLSDDAEFVAEAA